MADAEYDNTNKGALWAAKGFAGKLDIGGVSHTVLVVETQAKADNAPSYKAIIRKNDKDSEERVVPIFKIKKEGSKAAANFKYCGNVVFVFINQGDNPKAPILRLSAIKDEQKTAPAPTPAPPPAHDDSDLPF